MQKIYTLTILIIIFFSSISFSQYQNIRVDNPQNDNHNEVTIAINPLNPNILAAQRGQILITFIPHLMAGLVGVNQI